MRPNRERSEATEAGTPPPPPPPPHPNPFTDTSRWTLLSDDEITRIRMRSITDDPRLRKRIAQTIPPLIVKLERYWSEQHNMYLYREVADDSA